MSFKVDNNGAMPAGHNELLAFREAQAKKKLGDGVPSQLLQIEADRISPFLVAAAFGDGSQGSFESLLASSVQRSVPHEKSNNCAKYTSALIAVVAAAAVIFLRR